MLQTQDPNNRSRQEQARRKVHKRPRRLPVIVGSILVVCILAVCIGGAQYLVNYAIGRSGGGGNRQVALSVNDTEVEKTAAARDENASVQDALNEEFQQRVTEQAVTIQSTDGLNLNAGYYPQEESHRWALVVHGYRGNHTGMLSYTQRYHHAGYHVLAPDLRACGDSEGNYVGMGWPDRLDMLKWMEWILSRDPEAEIVMHGVSMGAATVMMTSGEAVPDQVIAFIEDCGYTSVWDIFSSELKLRFHLPNVPLLYTASALAKLEAGYRFTEASSLN